jgi:hypothetical protein
MYNNILASKFYLDKMYIDNGVVQDEGFFL